jgi:L-lactate dehydrogenase complex protein LldG
MSGAGVADTPQQRAVWADSPFLAGVDKQALVRQLPGLCFDVTRTVAAEASIGVSEMEWGIANTGTLVQDAAAIEKRLVSTLPKIHIALVRTDNIVADLAALFTKISPAQTNYMAFVSGPSRTADIERVLTIGVHGPERLVIVCVDEWGGTN